MRIAFFGSDAFSVPSLEALVDAGHALALVVTNPDRPRGRSGKPQPTPVKEVAERLGLSVTQPDGKPGRDTAARMQAEGVDLGVVVAYGQFLPRVVRKASGLGYAINVHASLLPRWRGAAPDAAAILAGDPVTGVTVQKVLAKMDAGPVVARRETPLGPDETRAALRARLARLGAEALVEAVTAIQAGTAVFAPQDEAQITYAPFLRKEDGRLDPSRPAEELARRVRAFHPWPGAFLETPSERVAVLAARASAGAAPPGATPGRVLGRSEEGVLVATGEGVLELLEVKPAGKRAMSGLAWANGRRLEPGTQLA